MYYTAANQLRNEVRVCRRPSPPSPYIDNGSADTSADHDCSDTQPAPRSTGDKQSPMANGGSQDKRHRTLHPETSREIDPRYAGNHVLKQAYREYRPPLHIDVSGAKWIPLIFAQFSNRRRTVPPPPFRRRHTWSRRRAVRHGAGLPRARGPPGARRSSHTDGR